jgi:hypothetical protein
MTLEVNPQNGNITISDIHKDHYFKQTYMGYGKREAKRMWKELHRPYYISRINSGQYQG